MNASIMSAALVYLLIVSLPVLLATLVIVLTLRTRDAWKADELLREVKRKHEQELQATKEKCEQIAANLAEALPLIEQLERKLKNVQTKVGVAEEKMTKTKEVLQTYEEIQELIKTYSEKVQKDKQEADELLMFVMQMYQMSYQQYKRELESEKLRIVQLEQENFVLMSSNKALAQMVYTEAET